MQFISKYEAPWADSEEVLEVPVASWRVQKPVIQKEKCAQCGCCYLFCPTGCIVDRGNYFEANLDYCKGCGICARECPKNVILMVREEG